MLVCAYSISPEGFEKRILQESTQEQEVGMKYDGEISLQHNRDNQKVVWSTIFQILTKDIIFDIELYEQYEETLQGSEEAIFGEVIKIS